MENIAVIIRVYSRITDAESLVKIIKSTWTHNHYDIFIAHNGEEDGYHATQTLKDAGHYIHVPKNSGHLFGARDLLQFGYDAALHEQKASSPYQSYVFIESDFWLLGDGLLDSKLSQMRRQKKSLAMSIWVEGIRSHAVDFFIVDAEYLATKHKELFNWDDHPEQHFAQLVHDDALIINELRPTHIPSILRVFPISTLVASLGRFRIFPKAPAVTHHLEEINSNDLSLALKIKQGIANTLLKEKVFEDAPNIEIPRSVLFQKYGLLAPQSSWFKKAPWNRK